MWRCSTCVVTCAQCDVSGWLARASSTQPQGSILGCLYNLKNYYNSGRAVLHAAMHHGQRQYKHACLCTKPSTQSDLHKYLTRSYYPRLPSGYSMVSYMQESHLPNLLHCAPLDTRNEQQVPDEHKCRSGASLQVQPDRSLEARWITDKQAMLPAACGPGFQCPGVP